MSPEQILGDKLDYRSDLFSLGICLYQMVTGRKPFIEDEQKSVMHKIRLEKYPNPRKLNPEIPRELERIMSKCMEKIPRDRWRSTQDLVNALERFLSRHVDMNYHARLVLFLRNQGVVGAEEAEQYLHPALATTGTPLPPSQSQGRALVRRVAEIQGAIAGAVALTVGLIHLAPVGATISQPAQMGGAGDRAPQPSGYARLVIEPWAEVYVDDETTARAVTPAGALQLEAGTRRLRLVLRRADRDGRDRRGAALRGARDHDQAAQAARRQDGADPAARLAAGDRDHAGAGAAAQGDARRPIHRHAGAPGRAVLRRSPVRGVHHGGQSDPPSAAAQARRAAVDPDGVDLSRHRG
jgi:hypothetical protein